MVGKWWISTAAAVAILLAVAPDGASRASAAIAFFAADDPAATSTATSAPLPPPSELVQQDIKRLSAALTSPTSTSAQRDESARRLVARQSPEGRQILLDVLNDAGTNANSLSAKASVARAIADDPSPDPQFAPALNRLVSDRTITDLVRDRTSGAAAARLIDAAARALGQFANRGSDEARVQLLAIAQDPNQPATLREAAIHALGQVVNRTVADVLVRLLGDASLASAADDALVDMTGLAANKQNTRAWQNWQRASANLNDVDWRAQVMAGRSDALDQEARGQERFARALQDILNEHYRELSSRPQDAAAQAEKSRLILRYLNDPDPDVQKMGITSVRNAFALNQSYPETATARIADLIGASSPDVRIQAAQALADLNPGGALQAIVTQVAQEPDARVKVALIGTLGKQIKDLRAVPVLLSLLNDPSLAAATAAADALRTLWPPDISTRDPAQAQSAAATLWRTGQQRAGQPGGSQFRAACIEAMGPLQDANRTNDYFRLMDTAPDDLRVAALHALGELRNPNIAFRLAQYLSNDPSPQVRAAAAEALQLAGNFENAALPLYQQTNRHNEPNATVQNRAWEAFEKLLPAAQGPQSLVEWSDKLADDPAHRVHVLAALDDKLERAAQAQANPNQKDQLLQDLAHEEQNTGSAYAALRPPDWPRAIASYRKALDYWENKGTNQVVTITLVRQLMSALLAAQDFEQAMRFAQDQFHRNRASEGDLGPMIRDEANSLKNQGLSTNNRQMLDNALRLINGALDIHDPPLDPFYRDDLQQFKTEIERRLAAAPR